MNHLFFSICIYSCMWKPEKNTQERQFERLVAKASHIFFWPYWWFCMLLLIKGKVCNGYVSANHKGSSRVLSFKSPKLTKITCYLEPKNLNSRFPSFSLLHLTKAVAFNIGETKMVNGNMVMHILFFTYLKHLWSHIHLYLWVISASLPLYLASDISTYRMTWAYYCICW